MPKDSEQTEKRPDLTQEQVEEVLKRTYKKILSFYLKQLDGTALDDDPDLKHDFAKMYADESFKQAHEELLSQLGKR